MNPDKDASQDHEEEEDWLFADHDTKQTKPDTRPDYQRRTQPCDACQ